MNTENLSTLKIHKLTQEQYDRELAAGRIDENALYLTPDEEIDLTPYATVEQLNAKANIKHTHDIVDVRNLQSSLDEKVPASRTINGKALTSNIALTASDVGADVSGTAQIKVDEALASAKSYTDTKVSGLASTTVVDNKISSHNTSTSAHNDIRNLISGLTTRLNALADSDDTTLDQMSEIVAYIKSNKSLIDSITTSKVSVSDIVNDLTTNVTNKPLSAAQGVAIKALIDDLQEELDSHESNTVKHITSTERSNWNAAKTHADSAHVTGVKGNSESTYRTGNVNITPANIGLGNVNNTSDANKPISTAQQAALDAKVPTSRTVNGKALSSNISITKADVGLGNVDNTADSDKNVNGAKCLVANSTLTSVEDMDNFISGSALKYATFKLDEDSYGLGFGSNDGMLLSIPWGGSGSSYGAQIAFDDTGASNIAVRGKANTWGSWHKLIHSGNIGSQSVATATKATQDASGNTISSTYATKSELNSVSALVGNKSVSEQINEAIAALTNLAEVRF